MKNFIKRIILFICFLSVFYPACLFLWGLLFPPTITKNLNYRLGLVGHLNRRIQELNAFRDIDVLFLGSSHTYRGFDPRIFKKYGIKSFNLGSSSQTPVQTEILLKRYLNSLNPELVVYEVYPRSLSIDGAESALDLIANDKIDYLTIKMALDLNNIKVYNTLIFGMIRKLLNLDNDFVEPIQKLEDIYVKGGFVERNNSFFKANETLLKKKWEFITYQKEAFERILKKFKKLKINVILVQAPITREFYDSYSNNLEIDSYFKSLADYYNFNEILKLPSTRYFYDSHHLNQDGVEIFNKSLLNIFKNNNYF
jgi:hypothetical protein